MTSSLVAAGLRAVASAYADTPILGRVYVDHAERAVFDSRLSGDRVVVKVVAPVYDRPGTDLQHEVSALAAARRAGVAVSDVLLLAAGPPSVLVLRHLDGEELSSASTDGCWQAVGRELRRLHDHAPTSGVSRFGGGASWCAWIRWWVEYEHDQALRSELLAADKVRRLHDLLQSAFASLAEPQVRLLHGDCGPYHWLLRDGRVTGALDFGDSGLGDPAYDLAVLTLWDADRLEAVLAGYGADRAFAAYAHRLLVPYHVIRHLAALEWLMQHDIDPAPTVDELRRIAGAVG